MLLWGSWNSEDFNDTYSSPNLRCDLSSQALEGFDVVAYLVPNFNKQASNTLLILFECFEYAKKRCWHGSHCSLKGRAQEAEEDLSYDNWKSDVINVLKFVTLYMLNRKCKWAEAAELAGRT